MIKTFISYYHKDHDEYKERLANIINSLNGVVDESVGDNAIDDEGLTDEQIRKIIRDDYLKETNVTIVLAGYNAQHRKHIDWEIHSSMYDGEVNKKSGILIINMENNLKFVQDTERITKHYHGANWIKLTNSELKDSFSFMPERLIENLVNESVHITILPCRDIINDHNLLKTAIELAHQNRSTNKYDLSKPMRRKNNDSLLIPKKNNF